MSDLEALRKPEFKGPLEELTRLLSQSRRAFLLGAGCSRCAGLPTTAELTQKVMDELATDAAAKTLLQSTVSQYSGATSATIEDYLSELVDLLALATRREQAGASCATVNFGATDYRACDIRAVIGRIKEAIRSVFTSQPVDPCVQRSFVRAVHRTLRTGKEATDTPVDYFVLNYDTLIEDALALEMIRYSDGLEGGMTGWWHADDLTSTGVTARVVKVHGSVDWCLLEGEVLPRRIPARLKVGKVEENVMIWPATTKYRETQRDPYAQMLATMRASLRPSRHSQGMLAVCGYRFGDSHINLELDSALSESSESLTVLVFTADTEPSGQVARWLSDPKVGRQVLVYARRGFYHGKDRIASDEDLPWWKFETLTDLLGGSR